MCYSIGSNKEDESRRLANLRKTLEEYYAEVKGGMDPKNTKMQFTFSWDYPQFKGHVEVNNDVSKRKK